jgi:hypothetical protein
MSSPSSEVMNGVSNGAAAFGKPRVYVATRAAEPKAARTLHVPVANRAARALARASLPEDLTRATVHGALRSVRWEDTSSEVSPVAAVADATVRPSAPDQATSAALSSIPWGGTRTGNPTQNQTTRSLSAVMATFKWEP